LQQRNEKKELKLKKMTIDHVPLPAFLYQSIFRNSLVDSKAGKAPIVFPEEAQIDFLGGNEKKIIFLINDSQNKFPGDIQIKFINDLLTACQLTMTDIALVNFSYVNSINYRELTSRLHPKKVLIFGLSADKLDLPFTIPFFQMQNFQEQVYMMSPSIAELQTNVELRKQLWGCLQKIFNLQK
jgi:DNA polymerase III psi subunit